LEEGTFVNAWLVENGYAVVMTIPPNVPHPLGAVDLHEQLDDVLRRAGMREGEAFLKRETQEQETE